MLWHVNKITDGTITGWVCDEEAPDADIVVAAILGDTILASCVANLGGGRVPEGVAKVRQNCCFSMEIDPADISDKLMIICLNWPENYPGLILYAHDKARIGQLLPSYQKFEGTAVSGFSESDDKLQKLHLPDLKGLSVLDIGCNEGFFCFHALESGAKRVVGIDHSSLYVEKAKVRSKKYDNHPGSMEFRCGSWWDLPDEKFDLILFMSAIHYEPEQKKLLEHLKNYLTPTGMLVLECGVLYGYGGSTLKIGRSIDARHFPGGNYLTDTLLSGYAVRTIGKSSEQSGDPVPRYVYHCTPKRPTVIVASGESHSGKTVLMNMLQRKNVTCFSSDSFLACYMTSHNGFMPPRTSLYEGLKTLHTHNMHLAPGMIVKLKAVEEFCRDFVECLPWHEELIFVEGEIFRHEVFFQGLLAELEKKNCVVWDTKRCL